MTALRVDRPGVRTLIQDLGRPGHARLGVTASGAWDRPAHALANRLLGNAEDAASLEVTLGGLTLTALESVVVAVTGADAPLFIDGRPASLFAPVALPAGSRLDLGTPTAGLRNYIGVRGGIVAQPVLGSLSANPTTRIGPAPLASGDVLAIGTTAPSPLAASDVASSGRRQPGPIVMGVILGPRDDWFTPEAIDLLSTANWTVAASDRVGTRLQGPPLPRAVHGELPSEGLIRGAIQVPTDGQPLVFGPDHPTTGGYPVIACVLGVDADALAQAPPGADVRFEVQRRA